MVQGNTPSSSSNSTTNSNNFTYNPMTTGTFQGFDNNISTALAGLNALSNSPSYISNSSPATPKGLTSPTIHGSGPHHSGNPNLAHKYEASPASDRSLDQRRRSSATGSVSGHRNSNGGYYVDVSVDPTMNLPHNKSHPTTPSSLTPRNSTSAGDKGSNFTHRGSISGVANISALRSNSIIQITTDERGSILSMGRASVSSLPSKSMNIPHHQLGNNSLAHLPVLFGARAALVGPPDIPVLVVDLLVVNKLPFLFEKW